MPYPKSRVEDDEKRLRELRGPVKPMIPDTSDFEVYARQLQNSLNTYHPDVIKNLHGNPEVAMPLSLGAAWVKKSDVDSLIERLITENDSH